jgi:arylformamidase
MTSRQGAQGFGHDQTWLSVGWRRLAIAGDSAKWSMDNDAGCVIWKKTLGRLSARPLQTILQETRMPRWNKQELDRLYNNRALVPDFASHFQRWQRASAQARAEHPRPALDVPYGDGPAQRLDVFPATTGQGRAPVMVFIHGGYWRSLDKADHAFVAPVFNRQGVCVVVPNYALCPAVSIPEITMQMVQALAWTSRHVAAWGGDPGRITVVGHSAGGHLAAMLLLCRWRDVDQDLPKRLVRRALSISGLYDLAPLRHTPFLQPDLRLTPKQVRQASPAGLPRPDKGKLYAVAGADESSAFLQQNRLIRKAWGRKRVPVCEALSGLNHFSVLEALVEPGHRLHRLAWALLAD